MSEELITVMNKKAHESSLGNLGFSIGEHGSIKIALKEAGLSDVLISLVDEIIEGK